MWELSPTSAWTAQPSTFQFLELVRGHCLMARGLEPFFIQERSENPHVNECYQCLLFWVKLCHIFITSGRFLSFLELCSGNLPYPSSRWVHSWQFFPNSFAHRTLPSWSTLQHCSSMEHTLSNIAVDNLYMSFVTAAMSISSHLPCDGCICKPLMSWKLL